MLNMLWKLNHSGIISMWVQCGNQHIYKQVLDSYASSKRTHYEPWSYTLTTTATPAVKRDGKDINKSSAYPDNVLPI